LSSSTHFPTSEGTLEGEEACRKSALPHGERAIKRVAELEEERLGAVGSYLERFVSLAVADRAQARYAICGGNLTVTAT